MTFSALASALCLALAVAIPSGITAGSAPAAQATIFIVRHAERTDTPIAGRMPPAPVKPSAGTTAMPADPDLSAVGHARAESLAVALQDAGVTAIFVTSLKRTQQTAAPLAKALGLTPVVLPPDATPALVARLLAHQGNALVVGHSNTVPEIVRSLGAASPVSVGDSEFDHLFVMTPRAPGSPNLVHLHYQ